MAGILGLRRARDILSFANRSTIARAQISPMVASARRLGLPSTLWTLNRLDGPEPWLRPRHRARVAFIQVEWDVRGETLAPFIDRLREHHPGIKVVFLDWYAPLHIKQPDLLPLVDVYVKKQLLADSTPYFEGLLDSNLLEYECQWNPRFADVARLVVDRSEFERKVVLGWNFATHSPLIRLLKQETAPPGGRPLSLHCRIASPARRDNWYSHMRGRSFDAVTRLAEQIRGEHRIVAERARLSPKAYFAELRQSRMCFSPFGYGEVCWRDFESIACGAVLVKPDMSHIRTDPNIYVPHETYIPVRWDFADLGEVCLRYFNDPQELARIARNASETWRRFLHTGWPAAWERVMQRAGIDLGTPPPLA